MGFRNIMISSNMKLRIQDQQLVVTAGDEVHIPLEDINCILIENQSVTLSAYLLQKVADSGIALYVCDEKHLPNAVLLPMVRHSRHFKILKYQMETGKPLQKRLWQQVVIQKIRNQALCLQLLSWMDMRNFSECVRKYSPATGHMWKPKRQHTISDVCTDLGFREEMIILLTRH